MKKGNNEIYEIANTLATKYDKRLDKLAKEIMNDLHKEMEAKNITGWTLQEGTNGYTESQDSIVLHCLLRDFISSNFDIHLLFNGLMNAEKGE